MFLMESWRKGWIDSATSGRPSTGIGPNIGLPHKFCLHLLRFSSLYTTNAHKHASIGRGCHSAMPGSASAGGMHGIHP